MSIKNPHSWINYPNSSHKKCTRCGCKMDKITKKYVTTTIFTLNGIESEKAPECTSKIII